VGCQLERDVLQFLARNQGDHPRCPSAWALSIASREAVTADHQAVLPGLDVSHGKVAGAVRRASQRGVAAAAHLHQHLLRLLDPFPGGAVDDLSFDGAFLRSLLGRRRGQNY